MVSLSGPTTASMTEGFNGAGNTTASGTVINTEPGTISWVAGGYNILSVPTFGTLTINQNTANNEGGYTWSFVFDSDDPALDGLDAGQSMTVTFNIQVFDTSWTGGAQTTVNGTTVVDTHQVTITIFGENEVCFTRGTEILTSDGPKLVEALKVGDLLVTRDNGVKPIRWIASSVVSEERRRGNSSLEPIVIEADALGRNTPAKDLHVSPQHRILIEGGHVDLIVAESAVLASAKSLLNGKTIRHSGDAFPELEYWHIALDDHEVIFANGCPAESFHVGDVALTAMSAAQLDELESLFPGITTDSRTLSLPEVKAYEGRVLSSMLLDSRDLSAPVR
ncbi:Hint domain-containing protein [Aliiroseovarius sp. YM-037]|uniref:Hint domain-containing protein n=1 Tax=Aliiroseovarius sp. YM-037 TaxID=3341728 RepID=UPI003A80EC25